MNGTEFDEILDQFYSEHSHEGTFNVADWEIFVFRKTGNYADCGALVANNHTDKFYFTGWFEEDCGNDLKAVMLDVIKYMFANGFTVKITVNGDIDSDTCENYSIANLKNLVKIDCENAVESFVSDSKSLNITVDKDNEKFTATFNGGYWAWLSVKNGEGFFAESSPKVCSDFSDEMIFDDQIKKFTENAFNYSVDFY